MNKLTAALCLTILLLGCQDKPQDQTTQTASTPNPQYDEKYCDGDKPKEDIKTGAYNGDPISQVKMGSIYDFGKCGTQDLLVAEQWYQKAVDQDFAPAQLALGSFYASDEFYKENGKYDIDKALLWLEKASASSGSESAVAMMYLGVIYSDEQYGTKDLEKAKSWLTKSADKGNAEAKEMLADLQ